MSSGDKNFSIQVNTWLRHCKRAVQWLLIPRGFRGAEMNIRDLTWLNNTSIFSVKWYQGFFTLLNVSNRLASFISLNTSYKSSNSNFFDLSSLWGSYNVFQSQIYAVLQLILRTLRPIEQITQIRFADGCCQRWSVIWMEVVQNLSSMEPPTRPRTSWRWNL